MTAIRTDTKNVCDTSLRDIFFQSPRQRTDSFHSTSTTPRPNKPIKTILTIAAGVADTELDAQAKLEALAGRIGNSGDHLSGRQIDIGAESRTPFSSLHYKVTGSDSRSESQAQHVGFNISPRPSDKNGIRGEGEEEEDRERKGRSDCFVLVLPPGYDADNCIYGRKVVYRTVVL
jgi:hypothetical protein